ncbi:hypothetical protein OG462_39240 [Streptomyces sp. NBC_01077]|uniref:hypothetical protein n=1 Tax=Streptomyces sp. NBC_01077 TaxID=2903746 RepID=UPI003865B9ED|nr:hypothetical protein OG462_39240 [Streptomyces sp. NBC_01077]
MQFYPVVGRLRVVGSGSGGNMGLMHALRMNKLVSDAKAAFDRGDETCSVGFDIDTRARLSMRKIRKEIDLIVARIEPIGWECARIAPFLASVEIDFIRSARPQAAVKEKPVDINRITPALRERLEVRNLFLYQEPSMGRPGEQAVSVRLNHGTPDGFPVGHVVSSGSTWVSYARVPHGGTFRNKEFLGPQTFEEALDTVLTFARYDDLVRFSEASGRTRGYTVVMGVERAEWLADRTEPAGITHLGGGRVRLTESAVAYLRNPPPSVGLFLFVTDSNKLWIDGDTYPMTRDA